MNKTILEKLRYSARRPRVLEAGPLVRRVRKYLTQAKQNYLDAQLAGRILMKYHWEGQARAWEEVLEILKGERS